jgi:hypothetical protein
VHAASKRQASFTRARLLNTLLQPTLQASLPSRGPSTYAMAVVPVEVPVVEVSVVVKRSLWIRVQASVPSPAACIPAKLPVQ